MRKFPQSKSIRLLMKLVSDFGNDRIFIALIRWPRDPKILSDIRRARLDYIPFDMIAHIMAHLPAEDCDELVYTYWDEVVPKGGHDQWKILPVDPANQPYEGMMRRFKNQPIDNQHAIRDACHIMESLKGAGIRIRKVIEEISSDPECFPETDLA